jgi:NO-binding membrane sensor protein with MHYT domain/two-component sensor histidine kinase
MQGDYNPWLVVLSVVVAVVASYVALDLASRVTAQRERKAKSWWLTGGSVSMGAGIWSMHFVAMLAYVLPIPVGYDVGITLVSLLLPIAVCAVGLHAASRATVSTTRLVLAGTVLGLGIITMHYTGMAAMRMQPAPRYEPALVALSVAVAVAAAIAGTWSAFRLRLETFFSAFGKKAGSAAVVGAGIAGMHYTAMAATTFAPGSVCKAAGGGVEPVGLGVAVGAFSLVFLMGTMLIAAYDAYAAARSGQQAADLDTRVRERTAALVKVHHRLVQAQEDERRGIARELHDRVGQTLTALGINLDIMKAQLQAGDREGLRRRLEDSSRLLESTADAIHHVMADLRPPMLDDHGLRTALEWYAADFAARSSVAVKVRGTQPHPRPPQEVEVALFRIAQEALNNVAKHARASRVEITLDGTGREYVMTVSDDGAGLGASATARTDRTTLGFTTMRERAEGLGGDVRIESPPEGGTRVTVRISW